MNGIMSIHVQKGLPGIGEVDVVNGGLVAAEASDLNKHVASSWVD